LFLPVARRIKKYIEFEFMIGYKSATVDMKNNLLFWPAEFSGVLLVIAAVLLSGCSRPVASLDDSDFRDPMIRKAQSKVRQGDKEGAVECLNRAIERSPDLAQAHLSLALLYDDYKKDYVRAIYHYERYLEIRPATQKRGLIEDLIRKAKVSFSASLSDQFSETGKKMLALEEENNRLKANLREVRENLAKRGGGGKSPEAFHDQDTPGLARPGELIAPVQNEAASGQHARTNMVYCVQAGDTLSLISAKVYRDPRKWKAILDANGTNLV
jgi:tetratricopeptide (TPR) repeat protein